MTEQLFSRRPVFDSEQHTIGYELNFYQHEKLESSDEVMDQPSHKVTGDKSIFIPESALALFKALFPEHPNNKIIISLSVDAANSQQLIERINHYQQDQYKVSQRYDQIGEEGTESVELLDIIILDLLCLDEEQINQALQLCETVKHKLLVQNIESHAKFDMCGQRGFHYFQGGFLTAPNITPESQENNSGLLTVKLLATLQNPDVTPDEVEKALAQDARIAYKLLLVVNSPAYGLTRQVTSLREAVIYIGHQQIKRWVSLIAMSNVEGKPQELILTAMMRSRMCEVLAERLQIEDWQSYFTLGLFSALDALLDKPMAELLEQLCLADSLQVALLNHEGQMGEILEKVQAYERAEWEGFDCNDPIYPMLMQSYLESVDWAENFADSLQ